MSLSTGRSKGICEKDKFAMTVLFVMTALTCHVTVERETASMAVSFYDLIPLTLRSFLYFLILMGA